MSKYRMCFLSSFRKPLETSGPTIGINGDTEEAAVAMSKRIWDKLAGEETATGYTLVDTRTGRACYTVAR